MPPAKNRAGARKARQPRILIVTPEITYLPNGMGNMANRLSAKAGGMADVSASLVSALFEMGVDVHVAIPNYRQLFSIDINQLISDELRLYQRKLPHDRIHLAEDRIFYYRSAVYGNYESENPRLSLAFQREVINNIIPRVHPDLIHCNDWMTGLIPAHARRLGIPSLFTVHNIHTQLMELAKIEDYGIDAAGFWLNLYYVYPPSTYEETRDRDPVDFLTSGIFAAHFINTVSKSFLEEIVEGQHDFILPHIRNELRGKYYAGCATGILNAPDGSYTPSTDPALQVNYTSADHREGKRKNKLHFQKSMGLFEEQDAPIFFWPSRLDPQQKGCQLLAEILEAIVRDYGFEGLQVAMVSRGPFAHEFHEIIRSRNLQGRVSLRDFDEDLSRQGFAAADFVLMPSLFEPCGLPQMIGILYGALPVVRETGGLKDTVFPLDVKNSTGNGFTFRDFDAGGLRWGVDRAMDFYRLPESMRETQTKRIMTDGEKTFRHDVTAAEYIKLYEKMLERPLVTKDMGAG
ncbi:glycogen synthase [bacterium]|nr:MAG: glycogen synthase [bacterium]